MANVKPKLGVVDAKIKWRDFFDTDYIASWDIDQDTTVTISRFKYEEVTGEKGRKDKCLVAYFKEFDKGMIVNVTNSKTISTLLNSIYPIDWVGKEIVLYVDNNVQMKGEKTSGLRVRQYLPETGKLAQLRAAIRKAIPAYNGIDKAELLEQLKAQHENGTETEATLTAALKKLNS